MPLPTSQALLTSAHILGHSPPQPWAPTQIPVLRAQHISFSYFYLDQMNFWPLTLIPVNMIHEGPGLGSTARLLESPIKKPSIIYENYRVLWLMKGGQHRGRERSVSSGLLLSWPAQPLGPWQQREVSEASSSCNL